MKNYLKKALYISFFIVLAVFLSVSCTRSVPEITYGFIQLVLYQGEEGPIERFSFFIIPEDEDGIDNLDELYLFHDREQLRWKINSDEWVNFTQDGRQWIGTRSISIADGTLPRGNYRAVLFNKGGESSERTFTFDADVRFPFPEIIVTDGLYTVNSQWPVNHLVCFDRTGNYVTTIQLTFLSGRIAQLSLPASVRTVALWAEDELYFCSAYTNVVSIN